MYTHIYITFLKDYTWKCWESHYELLQVFSSLVLQRPTVLIDQTGVPECKTCSSVLQLTAKSLYYVILYFTLFPESIKANILLFIY